MNKTLHSVCEQKRTRELITKKELEHSMADLTQVLGPAPDFGFTPDTLLELEILVDTTESNQEAVDVTKPKGLKKCNLIDQIVPLLVEGMAGADTSAADEISTNEGEAPGGVYAWTFAYLDDPQLVSVPRYFVEVGDLNPSNIARKWHPLYEGITYALPVLQAADRHYEQEHGRKPADIRPNLLRVFLTDGKLFDQNKVSAHIAQAGQFYYYYILVIGSDHAHDEAVHQWQQIAATHRNVKVEALTAITDAEGITARILSLVPAPAA